MKPEILQLLERSLKGQLSNEDERVLEQWLNESPLHRQFFEQIQDPQFVAREVQLYKEADWKTAFEKLERAYPLQEGRAPIKRIKQFWIAAASIIILVCLSIYYYSLPSKKADKVVDSSVVSQSDDVSPASQKATLILADNKTIQLKNELKGEIAREGNTSIRKTSEGELQYEGVGRSSKTVMHNLITPKGGYYNLTLSDGSRVWLNAASSLRYPANFIGKEREVILKGEAYFEVAKQRDIPFLVRTDKGTIQVLGTHFNVKNYEGEPMLTTLAEGSVKVTGISNAANKVLVPGQQARVAQGLAPIQVNKVDPNIASAWRHGVFAFNRADLAQVTRELSRWYDVVFQFDAGVQSSAIFVGEFDRNIDLSNLLLQLSHICNLNFEVQDRKVRVSLQVDKK